MKYVFLDSKQNEFAVDDETYGAIVALIQTHKLCLFDYNNHHPYTEDNPCVGRNICLQHLLQKQKQLVFAGSLRVDDSNRRVYRFVDAKGMIYTSTEDRDDEAKQSTDETLTYYGFTPPTTVISRGKAVSFYAYYATLYGDLHNASVIVLSYHHYHEKVRGLFLLYKHGPTKELSKKSDLYTRADELVEATKDTQGYYHVGGSSHENKYEADTLEVISQLESAAYNVVLKLQNGKQGTDIQTGEQSE